MKAITTLLLSLFFTSLLQAGTSLTFSVNSRSKAPEKEAVEDSYELSVLLGESKLEARTDEKIIIHDFDQKVILSGKSPSDPFTQSSLYSDIGFRVLEFQNRLMLGGALAAGNIDDNPMLIPYSEHLFSLRAEEAPPLVRKKRKGNIEFSYKKKPLFLYSLKGSEVDAATAKRFVIFLRYRYGVHPEALDELLETQRIPENITIHRRNIEVTRYVLSFQNIETASEEDFTPIAETARPSGSPILNLSSSVQDKSKSEYASYCQGLIDHAVEAAEEGNELESVCLFLGYTLASGEQLPKPFFNYRDRFTQNPTIQSFFSAINPQSQTAAETAVGTLSGLLDSVDRGRSVILIFRANVQSSLRESSKAVEDFNQALSAEPMIVGAWKDLGELYYKGYQPRNAWACFAAARALNPEHNLLQSVDQFEKQLEEKNPEFFLP